MIMYKVHAVSKMKTKKTRRKPSVKCETRGHSLGLVLGNELAILFLNK